MAKKCKTIGFILLLLVFVALKCYLFRFGNLDEIWHYNLCRGITMNNIPYRDINLIGMPLYYFIFALPMFIARKLIVYRMFEAALIILCALLLFFIVKGESGFGYAAITALVSCIFTDITSYNNLLFVFVLILYIVNKRKLSVKRNIMLGVITALAIWSRQTSGFIVLIAESIILIFESRKKKTSLNCWASFAGGFIGINLIFLLYLLATSTFSEFWDYCFFGLTSYSNVLKSNDLWGIPMIIIVVAVVFAESFMLIKIDYLGTISHILLTLSMLTVAIPTADMTHASFSFFMAMIPLMSIIKLNIRNALKPIIAWATVISLLFVILRSLIPLFSGITFDPTCRELDLIPMDGSQIGFVEVRDKNQTYKDQGYDVVVLSSCCAIVSIYDGSFNPPYDLFLVGSFGTHDPVDIVKDLCTKENTVIVIPEDYNEENWMNPDGIYECVIENCTPIDQVGRFVYYIPD